jgi:hypothetical protein
MKKYLFGLVLILILAVFPTFFATFAQKDSPKVKRDPVNKPVEKIIPTPKPLAPVLVFSEPVGADVYLDNQLIGKTTEDGKIQTPKNILKVITLKPGSYNFRFEYPEYQNDNRDISVRVGATNSIKGELKANFGFLLLTNLPKTAKVMINGQEVAENNFSWEQTDAAKIKVPLGNHQVQVLEKEYLPFTEYIEVVDNNPKPVVVKLKKQLVNLLVKSTVGAKVYLNNQEKGTISSSGSLLIPELIPEKYHLLIECASYQKYEKDIILEPKKEITLEQPLSLLVTSVEFVDSFESGLTFWNAPNQWQVAGNLLRVNGKGVGLPKEKNYCDATIVFGVQLLNEKGAAWVIRAQDSNNYYLFCLNSSQGLYPNRLVTYICRNGKVDLTKPEIIPLPTPLQLKVGGTYEVRIKMEKNLIIHSLFSNITGDETQIGIYKDPNNVFSCGNIGFTAPNGEDFQVHGFVIKPLEEK